MKSICSYEVLVSTYQRESCQSEDKAVCNSENFLTISLLLHRAVWRHLTF